jgi:methionyl-tRNA formyltransferase
MFKQVLIISDNPTLVAGFKEIIKQPEYDSFQFAYRCSKGSEESLSKALGAEVSSVRVKSNWQELANQFGLIISLHCKQLFPAELVQAVRCVNVHPGLNPYNRGWFPQVFSILNGLPTGATIHEIDEELDHGNIIAQAEVENNVWDTSIDIYNRVLQMELELLKQYLLKILKGDYETFEPSEEGNLNLKKDFDALCELDLAKNQSIGETIDLLRALTHGEYQNAFFMDPKTGKKVYVSIRLESKE